MDDTLTHQQSLIISYYKNNENVFITGPGGSGKSFLINKLASIDPNIKICAMTGCAAILLNNARTLHSWSGIGVSSNVPLVLQRIKKNKMALKNWKNTKTLIVDEVSMMSMHLFELLDDVAKLIRKNNNPFGGIQLLFFGDFYQLPPVGDKSIPNSSKFCFESPRWFDTFPPSFNIPLNKVFRQSDDIYIKILSEIRTGDISPESIDILSKYINRPVPDNNITILSPLRSRVDKINNSRLASLDTPLYSITASISRPQTSNIDKDVLGIDKEIEYLKHTITSPFNLSIKVGAFVMCTVNIPNGDTLLLANGDRGTVISFNTETLTPTIDFNGKIVNMPYHTWKSNTIPGLTYTQLPLILAWAITIHKSQGSSIDAADIELGNNVFECGQSYVALSRLRSLDGLYLSDFNHKKIKVKPEVKNFYQIIDHIV
jgi:ATP-dependent DNA helicase PIF1